MSRGSLALNKIELYFMFPFIGQYILVNKPKKWWGTGEYEEKMPKTKAKQQKNHVEFPFLEA